MEFILTSVLTAYILICLGVAIKQYGNIDLYYDLKKYIAIMGTLTFIVPILSSGIVLIWSKSLDASTVALNIQGFLELYLFSLIGAIIGDFVIALIGMAQHIVHPFILRKMVQDIGYHFNSNEAPK